MCFGQSVGQRSFILNLIGLATVICTTRDQSVERISVKDKRGRHLRNLLGRLIKEMHQTLGRTVQVHLLKEMYQTIITTKHQAKIGDVPLLIHTVRVLPILMATNNKGSPHVWSDSDCNGVRIVRCLALPDLVIPLVAI